MPKLFFASDCGWILIVITQVGVYFIPPVLSKLMESKGQSHVKNSRAAGRPVTLWLVSVCNYIIWSSHQLGPGCSQHPTSKCQLMNAVSLNTAAYVTAPTDNGLGARLLFVSMQSRKVSQNATTKYLMKLEATLYFMTGFILDRAYLWVPLVHFSQTLSLALLLCSSTPEHRQKHTQHEITATLNDDQNDCSSHLSVFLGESLWLFDLWNAWNPPWELLHFCLRLVTLMEAAY